MVEIASETGFVEDLPTIEPGSNFAVFIFTLFGILFGFIISSNICEPGFNVLKLMCFITIVIIGFRFGIAVKRLIDDYD